MQMLEAFRRFNAKPRNHRYDVTAISATEPPELVCALFGTFRGWTKQRADLPPNVREYRDEFRNWGTSPATNEVRAHIRRAFDEGLTVRLIFVTVSDASAAAVEANPGRSMEGTGKNFEPRPDMVGRVTEFDGDAFTIRFERRA